MVSGARERGAVTGVGNIHALQSSDSRYIRHACARRQPDRRRSLETPVTGPPFSVLHEIFEAPADTRSDTRAIQS